MKKRMDNIKLLPTHSRNSLLGWCIILMVLALLVVPVALILPGCGGGGGGGDGDGDCTATDCDNIAGRWYVTTTITSTDCPDATNESYYVDVAQDGCRLTLTTPDGNFSGCIDGNRFTWSGSFSQDEGTTTLSVDLTGSGNSYSGTATWSWTDGSFECTGSRNVTCTRS